MKVEFNLMVDLKWFGFQSWHQRLVTSFLRLIKHGKYSGKTCCCKCKCQIESRCCQYLFDHLEDMKCIQPLPASLSSMAISDESEEHLYKEHEEYWRQNA